MSKLNFSLKYREAQIIKHALKHYINRPWGTSKEVEQEIILLSKIKNTVDEFGEEIVEVMCSEV